MTIELPEALVAEAKAVAARRHATLDDVIACALRREIAAASGSPPSEASRYETGPFGILRLRRRDAPVDDMLVRQLQAESEKDELRRALDPCGE